MKNYFKKALALILSVIMALSVSVIPFSSFAKKDERKDYIDGEVIAVMNNTENNKLRMGGAVSDGIKIEDSHIFSNSVQGEDLTVATLKSDSLSTKQMLSRLRKNSKVKYAFPNYKKHAADITNDTYSKYQWALENNGQYGGNVNSDVNAEGLWESAEDADEEQIVAVADTGLDFDHPDFKDIIWKNPYGNKLVGKNGYDFSGENKDGVPRDGNGHGTHCAGIIAAAADNGEGISGINKSSVKIMPVKWLNDEGSGSTAGILSAYDYINRALDLGANIVAVNNSWGGVGSPAEQNLYDEIFNLLGSKGTVSVIAAGNESCDIEEEMIYDDFFEESVCLVPASTESEFALVVAATNGKDELCDFTNYSEKYVDIAAPGSEILSSVSYNCFNPSIYSDSEKAALIDKMQNFDGSFASGDFGYPTVVKPNDEKNGSDNLTVSQENGNFGTTDGKHLCLTANDVIKKNSFKTYAFEIPFTVEDETQPYTVSLMSGGAKDSMFEVYDVPYDTDIDEVANGDYEPYAIFSGQGTGNYWTHNFFKSNGVDEDGDAEDDAYVQSKNRKLVFYGEADEQGATVKIDDLAISKQSADENDFGKYDFYCGTSMATPYVAGAVALVKNAYPESTLYDIINIIKNTGRVNEAFDKKIETKRVLSLDNIDAIPPLLFSAKYNESGKVELSGSFKNISKVEIDGNAVNPESQTNSKIVVPDNNYNTNIVSIKVENDYGSDEISTLLSKLKAYPVTKDVVGQPSLAAGGVMLPAGDEAYYINESGTVGRLYYDSDMKTYFYEDFIIIDEDDLFNDNADPDFSVTSAAYTDNKLYFTAISSVSAQSGEVIGVENIFAVVDLIKEKTTKLCELPDEAVIGGTLAVYNGSVYLAGGIDEGEFSNAFYKYSSSKKAFEKLSASLPEGRAFTKFLQYGNKLVGVYGAEKDGKLPKIITFDGKKWKTNSTAFNSDDYIEYTLNDGESVKLYKGNLGFGNGGVFCNGPYIYGRGDTFTYQVESDKIVNNSYSSKNSLDGNSLIGTTMPGCFIGFIDTSDLMDDTSNFGILGSVKSFSQSAAGLYSIGTGSIADYSKIYKLSTSTSYAKLNTSKLKNAKLTGAKKAYNYGEKASFKVKAKKGYVLKSVSVNSKVVSKTAKVSVTLNGATNYVTAKTVLVKPADVKSTKVAVRKHKVCLRWKKPARAKGYQVQLYVNKRWKTVAKKDNTKPLKFTKKELKKGKYKIRVRAYNIYKSKTYYGDWSKPKSFTIK